MGLQVRTVVALMHEDDLVEAPLEVVDDFEWQKSGACYRIAFLYEDQTENPFFKEGRGQTYPMARIYCAICPVVVDCLIEGLDTDAGFRGGCSPVERTEIRLRLEAGQSLEDATESIWSEHRANNKGSPVPPRRVWDEWIT